MRAQRLLVCDIDNTLIGDVESLQRSAGGAVARVASTTAFGDRDREGAGERTSRCCEEWDVPTARCADHLGGQRDPLRSGQAAGGRCELAPDRSTTGGNRTASARRWSMICRAFDSNPPSMQRQFKLSYYVDPEPGAASAARSGSCCGENGVHARVIYSHDAYLDVLPSRASKGWRRALPRRPLGHSARARSLVAGDSGNDAEMLRCGALGRGRGQSQPRARRAARRSRGSTSPRRATPAASSRASSTTTSSP